MKLTIIKFYGIESNFNILSLNQLITRNTSKELQSSLYANASKGSLQSNLYGKEFNLVCMQMQKGIHNLIYMKRINNLVYMQMQKGFHSLMYM